MPRISAYPENPSLPACRVFDRAYGTHTTYGTYDSKDPAIRFARKDNAEHAPRASMLDGPGIGG